MEIRRERLVTSRLWGNWRGQVKLNLDWDVIRYNSRVLVSACETKPQDTSVGGRVGEPVLGAARVTVHNVAAHDGGVTVWVEIAWDSPLPLAVSYFAIPSAGQRSPLLHGARPAW